MIQELEVSLSEVFLSWKEKASGFHFNRGEAKDLTHKPWWVGILAFNGNRCRNFGMEDKCSILCPYILQNLPSQSTASAYTLKSRKILTPLFDKGFV